MSAWRDLRTLGRQYAVVLVAAIGLVVVSTTVSPAEPSGSPVAAGADVPGIDTAVTGPTGDTVGPGATPEAGPGAPGSAKKPTGVASACGARAQQVSGDPYSPPCIAFTGDNGGTTSTGVSRDTITVSIRQLDLGSAAQAFARISGDIVQEDPQALYDTIQAYVDYFNAKFQFYGRQLKLQYFDGQGSLLDELLGSGREAALADATRASTEVGAFAELNGLTLPYADALAQRGVVSFGAPYPSREWHVDRRPYVWSYFPDGTNVIRSVAAWMRSRIDPSAPAQYGGPEVNGKTRRIAIVSPENPEYGQSVDEFVRLMKEYGIPLVADLRYQLDLGTMPNQASSIIARLKDAQATTVIAGTDPIMLAIGLLAKANEQDYNPEWITGGLAFVDQDLVGQLFDPAQWQHAFGIAYNAQVQSRGTSYAYNAYKQMRPNSEPSQLFEQIYYQVYLLAIGVQMAGPNLNPQTFEAGMFRYGPHQGPMGLWRFGPGDYTSTDDFREVWWDAKATSPQNNDVGAWKELNGGARYTFENPPPKGPAPFFK
jgi:hypothetical protein